MLSSLGVTEISDLKLATDLRLKLSYNCWEQMLESLDFGLWALQHRLIEWKVVKLLASEPNRNLNWQDTRLVRVEGGQRVGLVE